MYVSVNPALVEINFSFGGLMIKIKLFCSAKHIADLKETFILHFIVFVLDDLDLELRLARLEMLMDRRPLLLNRCHFHFLSIPFLLVLISKILIILLMSFIKVCYMNKERNA